MTEKGPKTWDSEKNHKNTLIFRFLTSLNDSNPCSSLGVMNFQKWELFSGSPGIFYS